MPSRFDETPNDPPALTPEVAERVIARFAERQAEHQRAEALERERLSEVARVQELADLLGTTPDDVARLAREVQQDAPKRIAEPKAPAMRKPKWPIHIAYLTLLAPCLVAVALMVLRRPVAGPFAPLHPSGVGGPGRTLTYDAYIGGYTRESFGAHPIDLGEIPLVDRTLVPPPAGLKVTLATPLVRKSVAGPPGKLADTPEAARRLERAIRALVAYEEAQVRVDGTIPTVDYDRAAVAEGTQNWTGRPTYVGWHQIEVSDGRQTFRRLLPDRRYAKNLAQFQKAFDTRIAAFLDAKFFPSRPPANLRPDAKRLSDSGLLPRGTTLMLWNEGQTVWLRGAGGPLSRRNLTAALESAVANLGPFGKDKGVFQVAAHYPGGETFSWWATLEADPATFSRRHESAEALFAGMEKAFGHEAEVPLRGKIDHRAPGPPGYELELDSGSRVFASGNGFGYTG